MMMCDVAFSCRRIVGICDLCALRHTMSMCRRVRSARAGQRLSHCAAVAPTARKLCGQTGLPLWRFSTDMGWVCIHRLPLGTVV